ncbi:hypothetical protein SBOR_5726 [Sclerotinia borealis F-4128]|uniref:Uncharacterized protein n=1 Tax=Sclerotinia borealis (strain F-4128) TaxID=1432307 RepID=W9CHA4_SCLBF|nr:hypothetical protein SBOR_5726 [Sclerotinia borealis F-4128]
MLGNEAAIALNLIVDVKSRRFNFPDRGLRWTNFIGSIMLVREDKKDLTIHQAQALVAFCKHKIDWDEIAFGEFLTWSDPRCASHVSKFGVFEMKQNEVRQDIKNDGTLEKKFREFFDEYRKKKIRGCDASWIDEVSPYDM